jgi:hypothetical protein
LKLLSKLDFWRNGFSAPPHGVHLDWREARLIRPKPSSADDGPRYRHELIAAVAVWGRGWFLRQWNAQPSARDAGDANAVRRLRWGGMPSDAIQLFAIVAAFLMSARPQHDR